ncbi:multidrug effflux MFS transporter [Noviherbaspirillum sp.]|uniref:multidrug effflux MFS transporter n=1 Tax=Noviherbaspirillum sp. TaxID=1926288 RepID=UPI002B4883AB|nr:multidrug effflux MFS transporter [Noviherbaspirillum sp.]HJV82188.1 multidrug effflux MFS transporter [Noviherbaspirillum sp.]
MPSWILTATLAGLAMLGAFAIDTFLPSFPAIAGQFSVSLAVVQQTLSAYLLAFSVMSLFYGTLSDSFGRRPVVLGSLLLFTAASIGAALAPSFGWLLTFRVLQGLSAGGGRVVGQAIIRDHFTGAAAQRLMSHVTMVFGLAPAIAPVLGGYLHVAFGWRSVFVFMTVFGLALLLACFRFLPESLPRQSRIRFHPVTLATNYWNALRHPQFVARTLAVGLAFGGMGLYIASAPSFIIEILHLPETAFAWLFLPMIGGMVLGSALSGKLAHRMQQNVLLRIGFACMGVAAAGNLAYNALFVAKVPWAVLPLMLYTFGLGLTMPVMSLMALDLFPRTRGLAASLMSFVQMLIFSLVSGVVAPMLFDSAIQLAQGVLAFFMLTLACWAIGARVRKEGEMTKRES